MTKPTGRPRGRPKTEWYSTLMARVPDELVGRVKRYAARKQQSISMVIRDALELLIEDDRYQPFVYDTNGEGALLSDRNGDTARPAAPTAEIMSDRKGDTAALALASPAAYMVSDTKVEDSSPARQEPAIMSDTKEAFDTTRYVLGTLCRQGHAWHGSGQSLRRRQDGECLECQKIRARNKRQRQRQGRGEQLAATR